MPQHKRDPSSEIASRIIAKATEILDNYGIADLTMRRLGRELNVSPGALYWHFANKQQLLGAIADRILENREAGLYGVPTGFADLDELTNGLHKGQMIIVAARPAVKTGGVEMPVNGLTRPACSRPA